MQDLRCSHLPLFMECASAMVPVVNKPAEKSKAFNDPGHLGTAVHDALAAHVTGTEASFDSLAQAYDVDSEELQQLFDYGCKAWRAVKELFPGVVLTEWAADYGFALETDRAFSLTGHLDVCTSAAVDEPRFLDWKSGRKDYDPSWQMRGYCLLRGAAEGIVVWLRDQTFEVIKAMPEKEFVAAVAAQVEKIGKVHTPGRHCDGLYCPRTHECEAYQEHARHAVTALLPQDTHAGPIVTAETLARAYPMLMPAKQAIARFEAALNDHIDRHGELVLDSGNVLTRQDQRRKQWDPPKVMAALVELGVADPARGFKIDGKVLEQIVKDHGKEQGEKKGAAWMAFLESCEVGDALTYKGVKVRREVRGGTSS